MVSEIERPQFFEIVQRIHADKALPAKVVADVRKLSDVRSVRRS
jgi:hypothetical protein